MSLRKRERERAEQTQLERLRGRILSGIHGGHLNPGDRLPSYRDVAAEAGIDLRAAARIYHVLTQEGLVESRGKAGFFVASQERLGGRVLAETARWAICVLTEAWRRRIPLPDYPDLVRRCIATVPIRTACVESTADQLTSLCDEVHAAFGLTTIPIHADAISGISADRIEEAAPKALLNADVIITTVFQASTLRPLAAALDKPIVVIRLDPDLIETIERHLALNELTVICVDPRFIDRIRGVFGGDRPDRINGVLASNRAAVARLPVDQPVLITRAARALLVDTALPPSLMPPNIRALAQSSASEIIELIIRTNLEAMRHAGVS